MAKLKVKSKKTNNPVAKFAKTYNKSAVFVDRKKESKNNPIKDLTNWE